MLRVAAFECRPLQDLQDSPVSREAHAFGLRSPKVGSASNLFSEPARLQPFLGYLFLTQKVRTVKTDSFLTSHKLELRRTRDPYFDQICYSVFSK